MHILRTTIQWILLIGFIIIKNKGFIMTNLTTDTFDDFIKNNKVVLVDFYAKWCTSCDVFATMLENIEKTSLDGTDIKFAKINIEEEPDLANTYGISSLPTTIIFNDGEEIYKYSGTIGMHTILAELGL
jgi:thioredoxin 1